MEGRRGEWERYLSIKRRVSMTGARTARRFQNIEIVGSCGSYRPQNSFKYLIVFKKERGERRWGGKGKVKGERT